MRASKKDLNALLRQAAQQGAEITWSQGGHRIVRYRGHMVTVSATPRSGGAVYRVRADLRRIGLKL